MEETSLRYDQIDPVTEVRIDKMLGEMTLEETVGQMVQVPRSIPDIEGEIRGGWVGSVLTINDPAEIERLQHIAVEESRLGIPLIIGNDVIHGYRTIFPIPLAESCTWDPDLLERAARVAADEASACGTNWIFAPMVDISRDPRWGRIAESAGEDPFLGAAMAQARVRGFQAGDLSSGRRIAACPKHYVAYGAAEAGRDYNTVDVSERTLRDVYLPPFEAAFDAGAGTVMSSFNEIAGEPASCNAFILSTVLRHEWGWPGVVVSDYNAIGELVQHGVAADLRDAGLESVMAGMDMDMTSGAFRHHLVDLVQSGSVPQEVVDEAARRILRLKLRLGLFERPYADGTRAEQVILSEPHRALALEVAQKSIVLLKNEGGLLPLSPGRGRVALIGPLADDRRSLRGCWAPMGRPEDVETVLEGMRQVWQGSEPIVYVQGCAIESNDENGFAEAVAAAQGADVVVMALGESDTMSGEAHSRACLGLPGRQQDLVEAVCATGKPVVVILLSGRPLVLPWISQHVPSVVEAWHGGIRAGRAIADVLFGHVNPSGKLTATFPRAEGQIPVYYGHKPTGRPVTGGGTTQFDEAFKSRYLDIPNEPQFPFGHGLSYTSFVYSDLRIETPVLRQEESLSVSAVVRNTGDRAGDEIVQLYVRDLVASVTRPVKELKGFQRISLQPGEDRRVHFTVPAHDLGFHDLAMNYVIEPGTFKLWIGPDSTRGLEGEFEVRDA